MLVAVWAADPVILIGNKWRQTLEARFGGDEILLWVHLR